MLDKGNHEVVRRLTFQGIKIAIETDKGQYRHWYDPEGKERGKTLMRYPYGYFEGTKASNVAGDNMALDVYVGPDEDVDTVYVVRQMKRPDFKEFDEHKVMLGFESRKHAHISYLCHYDDERFLGEMEEHSIAEFKEKFLNVAIEKALAGNMIGVMMPAPNTTMNGPNAVPMMPMMNPMMSPMGMAQQPPPADVETLEGVEAMLNRVGKMKDHELLTAAAEIWGPGYQYTETSAEFVKCEIIGFLLDQKELLEANGLDPSLQGQTSSPLQLNLNDGQTGLAGQSNAASLQGEAINSPR